ncbi:MAG: SRPBCC domain-containing protein [Anaerolineales bacterium]|nr:SRPBCC domain-containing protein [Anaerolineales bacterium]
MERERYIRGEVIVDAGLDDVWAAWTTEDGAKTFFAPDCNIDLQPDGLYEIFFNPSAEPGMRGGDGLRVMAVQPKKMLTFTWNAPPSIPEVRSQRTHVVIRFYPEGEKRTRVTLHHDGWGEGGAWDEAFEYFQSAWNKVVLPRLRYRFEHGPVDWDQPPDLEDYS